MGRGEPPDGGIGKGMTTGKRSRFIEVLSLLFADAG
jgi:hypothetical protein